VALSRKKYTVTDGTLVLNLIPGEKGWFTVEAPFESGVITQAKSIEEAFENAYDARKALEDSYKSRKRLWH